MLSTSEALPVKGSGHPDNKKNNNQQLPTVSRHADCFDFRCSGFEILPPHHYNRSDWNLVCGHKSIEKRFQKVPHTLDNPQNNCLGVSETKPSIPPQMRCFVCTRHLLLDRVSLYSSRANVAQVVVRVDLVQKLQLKT